MLISLFLWFFFSFFRFSATVCLFCFIIGLIFCTGAGEYWLKMFDSFAGTIGLVVIALMEMIAVIYIYGHEKYAFFYFRIISKKISLIWMVNEYYCVVSGLPKIFIK